MKKTMYSTDPKPFIKNGSFVRVRNEDDTMWGVVVGNWVIYQNHNFDFLKTVLPDEEHSSQYIDKIVNPVKFEKLDEYDPDWEYRKVKPMPKLETGMFVFVEYNRDKSLGGLGVVAGNSIIYQGGGHDLVSSFEKSGEHERHNCKITAVAYGEYIKNFNSAEVLINNGAPMEDSKRNLWKAQD